MMERLSYLVGLIAEVVIGLRGLKYLQTGMSLVRIVYEGALNETIRSIRGHVWYAVDDDDMTEKVRLKVYLDEIKCNRITALLLLEVVDH